jgi:hypothetical protein
MNRRDFLKAAGLAAGAVSFNGLAALAPDVLSADLAIGDVLTFAGVYAVNPITRQCTDQLRCFVVTSIADSGVGLSPHPSL